MCLLPELVADCPETRSEVCSKGVVTGVTGLPADWQPLNIIARLIISDILIQFGILLIPPPPTRSLSYNKYIRKL